MPSKRQTAAIVALLLAAACSGSDNKAEPSPTPSATKAKPTPKPLPDPLTGLPTVGKGPLVGIKIDNAALARPYHRGLGRAAVVYEELVEGGSTRMLAVFESDLAGAAEVGPIRSVRESDIELARAFGTMSIAYSGGNTGVKTMIATAQRQKLLIDASYDRIPSAYRLGERRRDARNFYVVPAVVAKLRPGTGPRDIGLRFGPGSPSGPATSAAVAAFSTRTRVNVRYNPRTATWSVAHNGTTTPGVAPANIIIQEVQVKASGFKDVNGERTPYTVTIGGGKATVLRDGRRYAGTWQRRGFGATRYLDAKRRDILLRPGSTWILLVPRGGSVAYS